MKTYKIQKILNLENKNSFQIILKRCYLLMMLFQSKLGLSVLDLLGRSASFGRWTPLQKQETKTIGEGSLVAASMPKSILSCGRDYQLLRECCFVHMSAYLSLMGCMVFIMDDHGNFPNCIMILNSMFPSWMMILNSMFPCWMMTLNSMFLVGG